MIHYLRPSLVAPRPWARKSNSPPIGLPLFTWGFTGVVVYSLCGIVRGPSEAGPSGALLRSFQQASGRALSPSADLCGVRSVRSRR